MRRGSRWVLAGAMLLAIVAGVCRRAGAQVATADQVRMCGADDLRLKLNGGDGQFSGMSHNGTLLILINTSATSCRVGPFATISLLDASGPLPIKFVPAGARFMHPGPVVFPAVLAAGGRATSTLRWVAGRVYDKSYCVTPKTLEVTVGGRAVSTEFGMQICGEQGKVVQPTMTRLQTDGAQQK